MKICVISDLHGNLIENIEPCEVLFICGDISPLIIQFDIPKMTKWLTDEFLPWTDRLPVSQVILVAGNHDAWFERVKKDQKTKMFLGTKIQYLENELYEYISNDGNIYKIFGTPYCHIFGNWPFMRTDEYMKTKFSEIPEDLDILISHGAPKLNDCGLVPPNRWSSTPKDAGNEILAEAIMEKSPRFAFCGHIHEGNHELKRIGDTKIANVSILNDRYNINYDPLYLDI